jgi:hypothetical protein
MKLTIRLVDDRNRNALPVRRDIQGSQAGTEEQLRVGRIGLSGS